MRRNSAIKAAASAGNHQSRSGSIDGSTSKRCDAKPPSGSDDVKVETNVLRTRLRRAKCHMNKNLQHQHAADQRLRPPGGMPDNNKRGEYVKQQKPCPRRVIRKGKLARHCG
jgi:hypothetical protein